MAGQPRTTRIKPRREPGSLVVNASSWRQRPTPHEGFAVRMYRHNHLPRFPGAPVLRVVTDVHVRTGQGSSR
eukprot:8674009-Pyramimonas_sp.AAC.1